MTICSSVNNYIASMCVDLYHIMSVKLTRTLCFDIHICIIHARTRNEFSLLKLIFSDKNLWVASFVLGLSDGKAYNVCDIRLNPTSLYGARPGKAMVNAAVQADCRSQ